MFLFVEAGLFLIPFELHRFIIGGSSGMVYVAHIINHQ